jgi:hypothetical protein
MGFLVRVYRKDQSRPYTISPVFSFYAKESLAIIQSGITTTAPVGLVADVGELAAYGNYITKGVLTKDFSLAADFSLPAGSRTGQLPYSLLPTSLTWPTVTPTSIPTTVKM